MAIYRIEDFDANYHQNSQEHIKGFELYSEDEKIGSAEDLLVDDNGHIRYLVINTGIWIFGKKVLLPIGRSRIDYDARRIYATNLTKAQVESLPEFTDGMTVDFDFEDQVRKVYRPASGVGYAGYGTAPLPTSTDMASGVGYAGYGTAPHLATDTASGVGYAGHGTAPSPTPIDTASGVGYAGYGTAPLTPTVTSSTTSSADQDAIAPVNSYSYQQDPSLYEMNEQNHQQLRKYEERLIANRKQRNSGRAL